MLSARHRLRDSADIRRTLRGRRAGGHLVVVHAVRSPERDGLSARVGFVASRAVGGAVIRNRVKRRLRDHVARRFDLLPVGVDVLVRANPSAAEADYSHLGDEFERLLLRVLSRLPEVTPASAVPATEG